MHNIIMNLFAKVHSIYFGNTGGAESTFAMYFRMGSKFPRSCNLPDPYPFLL